MFIRPGELRLPASLRPHADGPDWPAAAANLRRVWTLDAASPSPGELAAATTIQAALAHVLSTTELEIPEALRVLDAVLASNPATP